MKILSKKIDFYVSNNEKLTSKLKADGLYISAHNKNLRLVVTYFSCFSKNTLIKNSNMQVLT